MDIACRHLHVLGLLVPTIHILDKLLVKLVKINPVLSLLPWVQNIQDLVHLPPPYVGPADVSQLPQADQAQALCVTRVKYDP